MPRKHKPVTLAAALEEVERRQRESAPLQEQSLAAAMEVAFPAIKALKQLATRLPGWTPGTDAIPALMDFLAVEYGWTPTEFEKCTPAQIVVFVNNALRRKAPTPPSSAEVLRAANDNDARDRYIYNHLTKGDSLKSIRNHVNTHADWESLDTPQGVSQAARRFAKRNHRPWPIPR